MLKMSHGSGFAMLQFPGHLNVADKKWHQLEVRINGQVSVSLFFHIRICMFPIAFACAETGEQKKRDWLIICIILSVLVHLIFNSQSTYVVTHILG